MDTVAVSNLCAKEWENESRDGGEVELLKFERRGTTDRGWRKDNMVIMDGAECFQLVPGSTNLR